MHHVFRKVLFVGGGVAALWGGSKLYNRWKHGAPPAGNPPTSTNSPEPGTTYGPGSPVDAAGNPAGAVASGGDLTGSQPGDVNGLYTTAGSSDTSNGAGTGINPGDSTGVGDTSSSTDASSILDGVSAGLDAAAILG